MRGGVDSEVTASELRERMAHAAPPVILDVRSRSEFAAGHIPGAIHMPFWAVLWRAHRLRAASDDPIVVYCGHGPRAELARAALRSRGYTRVACLTGHMAKWRRAGLPEER